MDALASKVAARYKGKKTTDKGNVVYMYSEGQIARRNAEKAKRLEGLRSNIDKLRTQVKKDLKSSDLNTRLTALVVGLIDETYERVGNDESAEDGHYGVTGWTKKHVSFGKGKATIKYVGKAGVKHEKTVADKAVLQALRDAYDACSGDGCLFEHDDGRVDASKVNAYLKKFDITAKDLRGLHANREMQERLRKARKGKLSEDKKEREKQLKAEFKEALEGTAEAVGHEPSTLKSQYLVPGLAEAYLKDGTVLDKMTKKASDSDHYIEKCSSCSTVVSQCRCYGDRTMRLASPEKCYRCNPDLNARLPDGHPLKASVKPVFTRVAARYAAEVRKQDLQQWASDLRKMTKIYRSIPDEQDEGKRLVMFREARQLFSTFRQNFETWVYKHVLPVPAKDESWIVKQVREKAWNAIVALREMLFPQAWNYQTEANEDAPWKLKEVIDTNVRRYQKAFNEAFKVLEEYLQDEERRMGGPVERAPMEERHSIAGVNVVIRGFGRIGEYEDDVDSFLHRLEEFSQRIVRTGFGDALKGLTVFIEFADFDKGRKTEGLVAGQYNSGKDSLEIFPLGFISSDGGTFTHEVGHRFWFRQLPTNARAHWVERIDKNTAEITSKDVEEFSRAYLTPKYEKYEKEELARIIEHQESDPERRAKFEGLARRSRPLNWTSDSVHRFLLNSEVGEKVHLEPISEYATSSPIEAFAEAFRIYIIEGPGKLGEWTRWFFKEVARSGGAKLAGRPSIRRPLM